jgi:N6-adenosine-specific RNA methylase IME4
VKAQVNQKEARGAAARKASRFGLLTGLPIAGFDLIMADPPWKWVARSEKGLKKSPERHYQTMEIEEIARLPVGMLAADDSILFLWCTWPVLLGTPRAYPSTRDRDEEADLEVFTNGANWSGPGSIIDRWGFRYATGGPWVKTTRNGKVVFGTGHRLRGATEPFLIGVRGHPKTSRSLRNLIEGIDAFDGERREHSRKPDDAYAWCEQLMPGARRLEIFSQTDRSGWTTVGDNAGKWSAP